VTNPAVEGERRARELFGDARYEASRVDAPAGFRRDLLAVADQIVFGQIYARPGIDLELRSLCTVSALTVLGHREQLKVHIAAALRIGVPADQIAEVITQMAMYAGFPAALNAMAVLDEITSTQP
jgi:4-carboxymuconolactone decarboxylase